MTPKGDDLDLLPCPLCAAKLWMKEFSSDGKYAARCDGCGFHGPIKNSKLEAVQAANRRATPPAPQGEAQCGTCGGEKVVDSGGQNPDGSWINIPCPQCSKPTDAQEREAFEAWRNRRPSEVAISWQDWQARANLAAPKALNHSPNEPNPVAGTSSIRQPQEKRDEGHSDIAPAGGEEAGTQLQDDGRCIHTRLKHACPHCGTMP